MPLIGKISSVVAKNVYSAGCISRGFDRTGDLFRGRNVTGNERGFSAHFTNAGDDLFSGGIVEIGDENGSAFCGEQFGNGSTDAIRAAANNCGLVFKTHDVFGSSAAFLFDRSWPG